MHCDLDLWLFDPKVNRAHPWLMGSVPMKFHEDRCKGEAVMRAKPFYLTARLQTDGQTDGRTGWFQYTPPNFVAGGIINILKWTPYIVYRITGIFCGCLIFAVFCGSIEIAEIKNRKIFQSRYNDEIMSEVSVQSRIFWCLSGIVVELSV